VLRSFGYLHGSTSICRSAVFLCIQNLVTCSSDESRWFSAKDVGVKLGLGSVRSRSAAPASSSKRCWPNCRGEAYQST
jgi:hypothetical protein